MYALDAGTRGSETLDEEPHGRFKLNLEGVPMSKANKKKSEYAAQVEANLSRMYQNYLDRLSEEMGRKIAKEDLDTPEKREQLAQEWKTRGSGEGSDSEPSAARDGESKLSSSKRQK